MTLGTAAASRRDEVGANALERRNARRPTSGLDGVNLAASWRARFARSAIVRRCAARLTRRRTPTDELSRLVEAQWAARVAAQRGEQESAADLARGGAIAVR